MEYLFLLGVYIVICIIVSSFFSDREIGSKSVFLLSFFLSPIIGILIGLSSKRVSDEIQKPKGSISIRKNEILNRIEEIKRLEDNELGTKELKQEKEELKKEFRELENTTDYGGGDLDLDGWFEYVIKEVRSGLDRKDKEKVMEKLQHLDTDDEYVEYDFELDGRTYTFSLQLELDDDTGYMRLKDYRYSKS